MIETERLRIYAASQEQMESFIAEQSTEDLKTAYTQMLDGCIAHPDKWEWYAIWMIESKDGTHIGELCFKGITEQGNAEIGYGITEQYRGCGYASEAVTAVTDWALCRPGVNSITAETDVNNTASQRVLLKAGFMSTGEYGEEGPFYIRIK